MTTESVLDDLMRQVFADMGEAVVITSADNVIQHGNAAAEGMFGYDIGELARQPVSLLFSQSAQFEANRGQIIKGQLMFRRKSGDSFLADYSASPIKDQVGNIAGSALLFWEVSDQLKVSKTLAKLHQISTDQTLNAYQRIQQTLRLGSEFLDLPLGIVSRIDGDTYTIRQAVSPDQSLLPGMVFALGETYCTHVLAADHPRCFHHAGQSEISDHPCYKGFGLEAYIGVPLIVDHKRYGTLNFSSPDVRQKPFTDGEIEFVRLFAQWIAQHIAQEEKLAAASNSTR